MSEVFSTMAMTLLAAGIAAVVACLVMAAIAVMVGRKL